MNPQSPIRNPKSAIPPTLLSLVLTLNLIQDPDPDRPLPSWWGRAAHALLLNILQQSDPAFVDNLHDDQGLRPFTASTLIGRFPNRRLDDKELYRLRFTALSEQVAKPLLKSVQPGGALAPGAAVDLDYVSFRVVEAAVHPEQQSWAASSSYQNLASAHLVSAEPPARRISLQFTSPTTFKSKGRNLPLPLPNLVFHSLLERWNSFAPLAFPPEARRYASECLAVCRYKLSSRAVRVKNSGIRIGAVGEITYTTLNYDRYWMSLMHALAAYSMFAGVGAGTSMGMGQCRIKAAPPVKNEQHCFSG